MALFNKDSQSQQKASNSPPEQDISSIKSSMGEQNNSQGNSFNNNNFNSGSDNSTNTSSQNQPHEEFVNPFSQSHSNSQPATQPSSPQNFSSSPQQNSYGGPNSLPSFQSPQSQNFSSTPQNSNAMSQDSLPSFQEPSSQQNTNSFDQNQSSMMPQGQEQNTNSFNPQGYSNSGEYISKDEVENMIYETTEKILEQQWENLTGKVQKVIDWKSSVESEVESIKEDINTMQEAFATLEKRLISKLNNYDKSILDVGSEIKALDKVFQKVTPTLVNNVTELGKIAKDLKGVSLQNSNNGNSSSNSNKDN